MKTRFSRKGLSRSREYVSWKAMMERCYRKKDRYFHLYGGNGISVCDKWRRNPSGFENFLSDMGARPHGMTLHRIKSAIGYKPSNCKWATVLEQNRNKSNCVKITYRGIKKTRKEWADEMGISHQLLKWRLEHGWTIRRAISSVASRTRPHRRNEIGQFS